MHACCLYAARLNFATCVGYVQDENNLKAVLCVLHECAVCAACLHAALIVCTCATHMFCAYMHCTRATHMSHICHIRMMLSFCTYKLLFSTRAACVKHMCCIFIGTCSTCATVYGIIICYHGNHMRIFTYTCRYD